MMLSRNVSRDSIADTPVRSTGLNGSSIPFGGDDIEHPIEDGAAATPELVAVDSMTNELSITEDFTPDITSASPATSPIAGTVARAAFLVTHWLVGEGER
jgi:hypothetical protein